MYDEADMDAYADQVKELLIDDIATLSRYINEREYAKAAFFMEALSRSFALIAPTFTMEAMIRRLKDIEKE